MNAIEREQVITMLAQSIGGLTGMSMLHPNASTRRMLGDISSDVTNIAAILLGDDAEDVLAKAIHKANEEFLEPFGIALKLMRNPEMEGQTPTDPTPTKGDELAAHRVMVTAIDRAKGGT